MTQIKTRLALFLLLMLANIFILAGCDKKDPLIATWQDPASGLTLQFKEEGNMVMSNGATSVTLTYEKQEPNTILIKGSTDGSIPDQTALYRIEENRLILTVGGVDSVFTEMK